VLGRRSFLIGCGSIAAAPAFARLTLPETEAVLLQSPRTDSAALAEVLDSVSAAGSLLRIDGWDVANDSASAAQREDALWIRVSSSWKAAWH
jgi:hypothetical protein